MTNITLFAQAIGKLPKEKVTISTGKCTDDKASFDIPTAPHSVVVADRGYCNFELLNDWDSKYVLFVVRHKDCPNNNVATLLAKAYCSLQMGAGKPCRVVKTEHFYQN